MSVDVLPIDEMDIARNNLLNEALLRALAKGAWGDGRQFDEEEHDYMVAAVGEHHTRYMSDSGFGSYVVNRFGFGIAPDIRAQAYSGLSTDFTRSSRDILNGVYGSIGEDVLDQYLNSTKGVSSGINKAA